MSTPTPKPSKTKPIGGTNCQCGGPVCGNSPKSRGGGKKRGKKA